MSFLQSYSSKSGTYPAFEEISSPERSRSSTDEFQIETSPQNDSKRPQYKNLNKRPQHFYHYRQDIKTDSRYECRFQESLADLQNDLETLKSDFISTQLVFNTKYTSVSKINETLRNIGYKQISRIKSNIQQIDGIFLQINLLRETLSKLIVESDLATGLRIDLSLRVGKSVSTLKTQTYSTFAKKEMLTFTSNLEEIQAQLARAIREEKNKEAECSYHTLQIEAEISKACIIVEQTRFLLSLLKNLDSYK